MQASFVSRDLGQNFYNVASGIQWALNVLLSSTLGFVSLRHLVL